MSKILHEPMIVLIVILVIVVILENSSNHGSNSTIVVIVTIVSRAYGSKVAGTIMRDLICLPTGQGGGAHPHSLAKAGLLPKEEAPKQYQHWKVGE